MRTLLLALVLIAAGYAVRASGLRVVVLTPSPEVPAGATVVVRGVEDLDMVESPNAVCMRRINAVTDACRKAVEASVTEPGPVLARLPYLPMLDQQSQPAPEVQH